MRAVAVIASLGCSACFSKPPAPGATTSDAARDGGSDSLQSGDGGSVTCPNPGTWNGLSALGFNTVDHEYGPWLSPDGLDLYFSRATQGGSVKGVYHAHRGSSGGAWGPEALLVLGSSTYGNVLDANVWLSDDQLRIYWTQMQGYNDIYVASRTSKTEPFPDGVILVDDEATHIDTYDVSLTSDENTLVYVQTPHSGTSDTVYISTRASALDAYTPVAVAGINQANNISSPMLTEDKLTLFWADDDAGGSSRIFTSTRTSTSAAQFSPPTEVENQPTNMMIDIIDPFISHDGTTLVFAMQTIGGTTGYDLYEMVRSCN